MTEQNRTGSIFRSIFRGTSILTLTLMMTPHALNASTIDKLLADNTNIQNNNIKLQNNKSKTITKKAREKNFGKLLSLNSLLKNIVQDKNALSKTKSINDIIKLKKIIEEISLSSTEDVGYDGLFSVVRQEVLKSILIAMRKNYKLNNENITEYSTINNNLLDILDMWIDKLFCSGLKSDIEEFPKIFTHKNYNLSTIQSSTDDKFDDVQIDLMEKFIERANDIDKYVELCLFYANLLCKNNPKIDPSPEIDPSPKIDPSPEIDPRIKYLENAVKRISDSINNKCKSLALSYKTRDFKKHFLYYLNLKDNRNYISYISMKPIFNQYPILDQFVFEYCNSVINRFEELLQKDFQNIDWGNSIINNSMRNWGENFLELDSLLNDILYDPKFYNSESKKALKNNYEKIKHNFIDEGMKNLYDSNDINKITLLSTIRSHEENLGYSIQRPSRITQDTIKKYYTNLSLPEQFMYSERKLYEYVNLILGNVGEFKLPKYSVDLLSKLEYNENHFREISPDNPYLAYLNTVMIALNQVGNYLCKDVMLLIMNDLDHVNEYHKNHRPDLIPSDFRLTAADFSHWIYLFIKTGHIDLANVAAEGFIKNATIEPVSQSDLIKTPTTEQDSKSKINPKIIELLHLENMNDGIIKESIDKITKDLLMVYPNDGNYIYEQTKKLADHFAEMRRLILSGNK